MSNIMRSPNMLVEYDWRFSAEIVKQRNLVPSTDPWSPRFKDLSELEKFIRFSGREYRTGLFSRS